MSALSQYFSQQDLEYIKSAVTEAEKTTSAEIVPFFAESSHHYKEWIWLGSFLMGALSGLIFLTLQTQIGLFWEYESYYAIASVWSGAIFGLVFFYLFKNLRLLFVPKSFKQYYVELRSKEAFLSEEVFRTKSRTGILIYISLSEHIVRVLPDKTIAKIVPQSDWAKAVQFIVEGMRSKQKKDGIVKSIQFCGELLKTYNIQVEKDDKNEISNELRDGGRIT